MLCFSCKPIVKLNDEGKKLTKTLQNLTYVYLLLAIFKLFLGDFNNFFGDILTILMIVLTYNQANYFMATFLIFILIFQTFFTVVVVFLFLQNYFLGFLIITSGIQLFYMFIIFSSLVLDIVLIYYSFLAYREYKALFGEQSSQSMYNYNRIPDQEMEEVGRGAQRDSSSGFAAFQGRGTTWG